jgi:hypothetical protein
MTVASRPPTRLVPITVLTACFALSMAAAGCKDEKKLTTPPPASEYLARSSIVNVLANLQKAYGKENIDEYRKLFTEDFIFVFNPMDPVDPNHPSPPQWGLAEELDVTENMFADSSVFKIELSSFVLGVPERVDSVEYRPRVSLTRFDRHLIHAAC